ncbi:MAG TPA: sulfotransferase [Caulobacteraceae bacterium]|nr:sulfotransferase [Caulobacteraceae bacterium]
MKMNWSGLGTWISLLVRKILIDASNFYLLQHRSVGGFLMSGKNSGTHWLRFMLSHAMAQKYLLSAPAYSCGPNSEDFIGQPRPLRRHPHVPFIASSHNLPSSIFAWPWVARLLRLPPIVVLVRDPKEAMLSHFVKWAPVFGLDLHEYICESPPHRKTLADAWWYIDFFNRWGRMREALPDKVLVIRYEDMLAAPERWLRRAADHLGVELDIAAIEAGLAVSSREAVRDQLDLGYGEVIVPDEKIRASATLTPEDEAVLTATFARHLRHDFGYGYARPDYALAPEGRPWAKSVFALTLAYVLFSIFGRPGLGLNLPDPWDRIELAADFCGLTVLGPIAFRRLNNLWSAWLAAVGAMVEVAQLSPLVPGVASFTDLWVELMGISVALFGLVAVKPLVGRDLRNR